MDQFDKAFSKLTVAHKKAIVAIIHVAAARPHAVPAFIVLDTESKKELQAIPIGDYRMDEVIKMCKWIGDPSTEKFERVVFTDPPNDN